MSRTNLAYEPFDGTARVFVSSVDPDPGEDLTLRWDLNLALHTEDDVDPGLAGAVELRKDARNGLGSAVIKRKPAKGNISLCLFNPDDNELAVEVDAVIRQDTYRVTDKTEGLVVRVRIPGMSVDSSVELLRCVGRSCRVTTKPVQVALPMKGKNRATTEEPVS